MLKKIYHITDGEKEMYEIDARAAVKGFPKEWADEPWPTSKASAKPSTAENSSDELTAPFEGKDKGAGWWAIFDANGKQVGGNIRKPEAESFNAMSEEDKAEYVKAETAAS